MALIVGKVAASLWINRKLTPFDPANADADQLNSLSYDTNALISTIDEICEENDQVAPFWLDFVRDLETRSDEIIVSTDDSDDPDFEDDSADYEDDSEAPDPDQGEPLPYDEDISY